MSKRLPFSRAERVATQVHQVLAQFIHDSLNDPRVERVQITDVRITKDLRLARINYFLRGSADEREACQEGLESASGKMKRVINEELGLRFTPHLEFYFDDAIERGEHIGELLQTLHDEES